MSTLDVAEPFADSTVLKPITNNTTAENPLENQEDGAEHYDESKAKHASQLDDENYQPNENDALRKKTADSTAPEVCTRLCFFIFFVLYNQSSNSLA